MSELVERQFPAKALLAGLREMGYSFSTAVADIIDNSLSAGASEIKVFSDPLAEEPYFCILDNGCGMDRKELDNAMLPGSDREGKEDCETELGRFGLGLKSASLSQCREFTVASKKYGKLHAMSFDLDVIEREDKLLLKQLASEETAHLPNIKLLEAYDTGTLVVWTKFDKIQANAKNFEDTFRSVVAEAKKHVELVFHRFYESVSIYFNNKRIERRDPFLLDSEGRTQRGRESKISLDRSEIVVNAQNECSGQRFSRPGGDRHIHVEIVRKIRDFLRHGKGVRKFDRADLHLSRMIPEPDRKIGYIIFDFPRTGRKKKTAAGLRRGPETARISGRKILQKPAVALHGLDRHRIFKFQDLFRGRNSFRNNPVADHSPFHPAERFLPGTGQKLLQGKKRRRTLRRVQSQTFRNLYTPLPEWNTLDGNSCPNYGKQQEKSRDSFHFSPFKADRICQYPLTLIRR